MKILIISESAGFPWGMAGSTRIRNIAKALINEGCLVQYVGLRALSKTYLKNNSKDGITDGIKFSYPGIFFNRPENKFLRRLDDFTGKWFSYLKIMLLKRKGELDAVIIYSRSSETVTFWAEALKKKRIKIILELCEWPLANLYDNKKSLENANKFCTRAILKVDAILPISKYIENKVCEISKKNEKTIPAFRIPILTDFILNSDNRGTKEINNGYILYSGSSDYTSIAYFVFDVLIGLFREGYNLKLKFTGAVKPELRKKLDKYIDRKIDPALIDFTGYLEEAHLLNNMTNALCLLAPLPETEQSMARFPTKIGYYMSCRRPVVTNAVGSVKEYLIDGENAYVTSHFDSKEFVHKISEIINNPSKASKIGENGAQFAYENFYYKNACRGLGKFLTTV